MIDRKGARAQYTSLSLACLPAARTLLSRVQQLPEAEATLSVPRAVGSLESSQQEPDSKTGKENGFFKQ